MTPTRRVHAGFERHGATDVLENQHCAQCQQLSAPVSASTSGDKVHLLSVSFGGYMSDEPGQPKRSDKVSTSVTRYHFSSPDYPRACAQRLRKELASLGVAVRITKAQDTMARIHGYRDWAELMRITGTMPPSPRNSECPPKLVATRREQAIRVLVELCTPQEAERILPLAIPHWRDRGVD